MAEPKKPKRPPIGTPEAPLPRLWKAEPDEDDEKPPKKAKDEKAPEPAPAPKPKRKSIWLEKSKDTKKKESKKKKDGESKGVLKEETPTFDTYEARQRVRIIAGSVITSVFLLVGFIFYKVFLSGGETPPTDAPIPPEMLTIQSSTAGTQGQRDEEEARQLFDRAKEVARNKNTNLAISLLKRVNSKYPKTPAAIEAKAALERPLQNPPLPLFLDRPAVVAQANDAPAPKPEPPKPDVPVVAATTTKVASTSGGQARLAFPPNAAEGPTGPTIPTSPTNPTNPTNPQPSVAQGTPSRPLPKGYRARQGSEIHETGWPMEIVGDRDGAPMMLVPGGTFIQGRDDSDSNEGPAHKVLLGTFYIDRHEVTVRQFNLFQREAGKRNDRDRALAKDTAHSGLDAEEDRPVVMVSARDAKDFADWAGKFLPTEAQWEAAARTTDGRIFPWGPEPPAWTKPRASRQIDPIMSFPSDVSPYGVFDLAGNTWEWTKDWYDRSYYQQFRHATANNPTGPSKPRSQQLVVKGSAKDWTVSKRDAFKFDVRLPYLGFRCVLQVEGPGNAFEPPPVDLPAGSAQPGAGPANGTIPF